MTSDKLPEGIQEQIKADAEAATDNAAVELRATNMEYAPMVMRLFGYKEGYIAGATAESALTQRMADALEFVKANGLCSETTDMINNALQQWKDGKEKEVANE